MSRKTQRAAASAVAAIVLATFAAADLSGARAQDEITTEAAGEAAATSGQTDPAMPRFVAQPVVQPLAETEPAELVDQSDPRTLADLVAVMPANLPLSNDMHCLAGAIYFEARGEPLSGQLAVGRVIVNRAESSRFPDTYCEVVFQRSQFSFVRGGQMPAIKTGSAAWQKAKAIARIAHEGLWDSPAQGALFFHATHVSPKWRLQRVATVNRHIFYR